MNYFIWRQQDATRNSISSVAQSLYSHRELEKKSSAEKQEMIFQKGINWNDYSSREKRGGIVEKVTIEIPHPWVEQGMHKSVPQTLLRTKWTTTECPIFTQDTHFLAVRVPNFDNPELETAQ
jgi:tRNA(His) guanylyltransferase